MIKHHVKTIVSSKTDMFDKKMNDAIEELENDSYTIESIYTDISFAGKEGYMLHGTIGYYEEVLDDLERLGFNIDFGTADIPSFDSDGVGGQDS